jgi:hypothetical protein
MTHTQHNEDFYKTIRENRMLMYSKPKRYFNRDEQQGSTFKFLFLVETIVFLILIAAAGTSMAQTNQTTPMATVASNQASMNIYNYNTVYNTGKVFVSWTSKNEPEDCIYVVERSGDGKDFQSVGVKEGIGADIELYYSWIDQTPPAGFAYYRVKKITKEGTQLYSAVNSVINQASNFQNYAQGEQEK